MRGRTLNEAWRRGAVLVLVSLSACTTRLTSGAAEADPGDDATVDESASSSEESGPGTNDTGVDPDTGPSGVTITWDGPYEDDCGNFLGCPLDVLELEPCDYWAQDCPDGEKCSIVDSIGGGAWDAYRCVPVDPAPAGVGEPCTMVEVDGLPYPSDTCDARSMCYDVDAETGSGTCVGFCLGPEAQATCAEPGHRCRKTSGVLALCLEDCSPLLTGQCPTGQNCVPEFEGQELGGFICFPPAAEGVSGEECSCTNCCAAHHMCVTAAEYGPGCQFDLCCTEFCDITDGSFACAGQDQQCVPLFPPGTPAFGDVGQCVVVP